MTFGESVDRARARCVSGLKERISERRAEGRKVVVEAAPRSCLGQIVAAPDGLKLPLRYDLVATDAEGRFQPENADSVTIEFPEPRFVTWEHTLSIEIHRLCWDYMQFELPMVGIVDWEWLRNWFLRWFDTADARPAGADGLFGVVHFVSEPKVEADVAAFFVDFGSAPTDAFAGFLDELVRIGVSRCVVGRTK